MTDEREGAAGANELGELRALEEALGRLPTEARVPRDLWPDIRARLSGARPSGAGEPGVVPLRTVRPSGPRRLSLTVPQLAAAGLALAFVSGGAVWLALNGGPPRVADSGPVGPAEVVAVSAEGSVQPGTIEEYRNAVADLERVLEEGRDLLGPETVRALEESLRTIDGAIDEAREALARDPGSEMLNRHLARNMWKKMEILRQTAVAIRARST